MARCGQHSWRSSTLNSWHCEKRECEAEHLISFTVFLHWLAIRLDFLASWRCLYYMKGILRGVALWQNFFCSWHSQMLQFQHCYWVRAEFFMLTFFPTWLYSFLLCREKSKYAVIVYVSHILHRCNFVRSEHTIIMVLPCSFCTYSWFCILQRSLNKKCKMVMSSLVI